MTITRPIRNVMLALSLALAVPAMSFAAERTLTGELVILQGSTDRFRLVDHGGTFSAPTGTSLEPFDGKPVRVQLSSDGKVATIEEMPIHAEPVAHGFEVVSGVLLVSDPTSGSFSIAGDGRTYRAPAGVDVRSFANRMVEVRLDQSGQVAEVIPAARAADAPPVQIQPAGSCSYNGHSYSAGAPVCQNGLNYRCENGEWRNLGTVCGPTGSLEPNRHSNNCLFGGATVASGSSICRSGDTLRCADGEWINVHVSCG